MKNDVFGDAAQPVKEGVSSSPLEVGDGSVGPEQRFLIDIIHLDPKHDAGVEPGSDESAYSISVLRDQGLEGLAVAGLGGLNQSLVVVRLLHEVVHFIFVIPARARKGREIPEESRDLLIHSNFTTYDNG